MTFRKCHRWERRAPRPQIGENLRLAERSKRLRRSKSPKLAPEMPLGFWPFLHQQQKRIWKINNNFRYTFIHICVYIGMWCICVWVIDWICENPKGYRSGREIVRKVIRVETIQECWVCVVLCWCDDWLRIECCGLKKRKRRTWVSQGRWIPNFPNCPCLFASIAICE